MKRLINLQMAIALVITISVLFVEQGLTQQQELKRVKGLWKGKETEFVAGNLFLKIKPLVQNSSAINVIASYGGKLTEQIDINGWGFATFSDTSDLIKIAESLTESGMFESIHPNFICYAVTHHDPCDAYFPGSWPYDTYYSSNIDVLRAWDITTGVDSITRSEDNCWSSIFAGRS